MTDGDVVVERRVSAPPAEVFSFFTDAERWTAWQGTEAEVELFPGGVWRVNVTGDGFASGRVVEVVENERVVFTWGWEQGPPVPPGSTTVAIDLLPDGDGTLIRLTHSGLPPDLLDIHRHGWEHYVPRLAAVAEGRAPDPNRPGG
ncbi:MAG TPA: SRPBCC domain-containing protein [Actinomycetota bacterium]|nr:SRPBCC domain-containing protein [Actinomycetota bacterium]